MEGQSLALVHLVQAGDTVTQLLTDLRSVRELIGVPERWTQGVAARDSEGASVDPKCGSATCWCVFGAVQRRAWEYGRRYEIAAAIERGGLTPRENDRLTHAEVLALLDKAIAAEERKAAP